MPGPWEGLGLWGSSSPVRTVAHRGQHLCLVQVSWEAVQHPSFLDAVLLVQTISQSLGDDTVWHCRGRRIRKHSVANSLLAFPEPHAELLQTQFWAEPIGATWTRPLCGPATRVADAPKLTEIGSALGDLGPRLSHLNKTPSSFLVCYGS